MTLSKPKEDLITATDRPQSPDYTDMISPEQKKQKAIFGPGLSNTRQECVQKRWSQSELLQIFLMLMWRSRDDI